MRIGILIALLLTPSLFADDDLIEYDEAHLQRYERPNFDAPLFERGDRVRGLFRLSYCNSEFRLYIDNRDLIDTTGRMPPDEFVITSITPEQVKPMEDLLQQTIDGVVRINSTGTPILDAPGFHSYPVRVEEVHPAGTITNPSDFELSLMDVGNRFIIRGKIIKVGKHSVTISTDEGNFAVNGVPNQIARSLDPEIEVPSPFFEVGDSIQFRAIKSIRGIALPMDSEPTYLVEAGPKQKEKYASARHAVERLLSQMEKAAKEYRISDLAEISQSLAEHDLTAGENERRIGIVETVDANDQPIWAKEFRENLEYLELLYGLDVSHMTRAELLRFAEGYAENRLEMDEDAVHDITNETRFFEILEENHIAAKKIEEIAEKTIASRLEFLKKNSDETNRRIHEAENLSLALSYYFREPTLGKLPVLNRLLLELEPVFLKETEGDAAFAVARGLAVLNETLKEHHHDRGFIETLKDYTSTDLKALYERLDKAAPRDSNNYLRGLVYQLGKLVHAF